MLVHKKCPHGTSPITVRVNNLVMVAGVPSITTEGTTLYSARLDSTENSNVDIVSMQCCGCGATISIEEVSFRCDHCGEVFPASEGYVVKGSGGNYCLPHAQLLDASPVKITDVISKIRF